MKNVKALAVIDSETLMNSEFRERRFCVETLLPQGLCMLAGAPKIGKSWMALDLALHVAKGEALWGLKVHPGTVLYLCLEDGNGRIHDRLNAITDEGAGNLFLSFEADSLNDGLIPQLMNFKKEHPDLALIIIDTFQIIRKPGNDTSYASDYEEVRQVKRLADELNLTILLIHHLRKMGDSDPLNKISGSTGISGAVDAVFVLDHAQRGQADGVLECTGRDIPSRRIELHFDSKTCIWSLMKDSLDAPEILLPPELSLLSEFMRAEKEYRGDNSEFAERYNTYAGTHLSPKALKQMMNRSQRLLAEHGVKFQSKRSNGQRYLFVQYLPSALPDVTQSAVSDAQNTMCETCVPSVPCVPDI